MMAAMTMSRVEQWERRSEDTYAHLLAGAGKKAAEAADALVPRKLSDHSVTSSGSGTAGTPA
jgi:hypothetical protein